MSELATIAAQGASVFDALDAPTAPEDRTHFLKFSGGDFLFGKKDEEELIMPDEIFVADIQSTMAKGYLCWGSVPKQPPVAELSVLFSNVENGTEQFIQPADLATLAPDYPYVDGNTDGWSESMGVTFSLVDDPSTEDSRNGEKFKFSTSTVGGKRALGALAKSYIANARSTGKYQMPMISMTSYMMPNKYQSRGCAAPQFDILGWYDTHEDAVKQSKLGIPPNKAKLEQEFLEGTK